jgi:hypothetical protein
LCLLVFGGLTGETPVVRPAATRRSDRCRQQEAEAASGRLDRTIYTGQTDGIGSIRPADQLLSDRSTSDLRVTFNSAKNFGFWVLQLFTPLGWLSYCCSVLQNTLLEPAIYDAIIKPPQSWSLIITRNEARADTRVIYLLLFVKNTKKVLSHHIKTIDYFI